MENLECYIILKNVDKVRGGIIPIEKVISRLIFLIKMISVRFAVLNKTLTWSTCVSGK